MYLLLCNSAVYKCEVYAWRALKKIWRIDSLSNLRIYERKLKRITEAGEIHENIVRPWDQWERDGFPPKSSDLKGFVFVGKF